MAQVGIRQVGFKYAAIVAGVVLLFTNFIACGSQFYQMSLHGDTEVRSSGLTGGGKPRNVVYGIHAPSGWSNLPIVFQVGSQMSPDQRAHIKKAMKTWEWATGKPLFEFAGVQDGVDGDTFEDLYSSLDDGINGHYLDFNWDKTGKSKVVLATTIWDNSPRDPDEIMTADIRFNLANYLIGDSLKLAARDNKEVVDMQSLALHEIGHLLGLAHIDAKDDRHSIMNPSLFIGEGLISREISRGDIERIQSIYGCDGDACDIEALLAGQAVGSAKSAADASQL